MPTCDLRLPEGKPVEICLNIGRRDPLDWMTRVTQSQSVAWSEIEKSCRYLVEAAALPPLCPDGSAALQPQREGKMNFSAKRMLVAAVVSLALIASIATAQDVAKLPYMNPSLSPEQRAADLVHRMTLEEKASQLVNQARAIPRLEVPAYDWWSEALHGVAVDGTTEFPEPIGLAATFDAPGIHTMATAIGIEGRIKHVQSERAGHSNIFEGLDFWAPNVNIFRDPRWGRGQETYGEDPFLSAHGGRFCYRDAGR